MQRTSSPSRRPSESGAWRWQQRSSRTITSPARLRNSTRGSLMIVRAIIPESGRSWLQAATYQQFLMNISGLPLSRVRVSIILYRGPAGYQTHDRTGTAGNRSGHELHAGDRIRPLGGGPRPGAAVFRADLPGLRMGGARSGGPLGHHALHDPRDLQKLREQGRPAAAIGLTNQRE